ncbi:MAG: DUF302 domain-containing protein [Patescibacteria group bacterium]
MNKKSIKFDYTTTTTKTFEEAVQSIQDEIAKAGFRVLYIHDVYGTLAEKGFKIEPMKIIEFCNAKSAFTVLREDVKIGLCLPCKILVYTKNGRNSISGMRPTVLRQFFPNAELGALPEEIDGQIESIINNSK